MKNDIIALVGAGMGGKAVLETLLEIPGVEVRYVVDVAPDAPGMKLARKNGIKTFASACPIEVAADPELDLLLEVTGKSEVFQFLERVKHPNCALIGAPGMKVIFHLLEAQQKVAEKLDEARQNLEQRVIERTEELAKVNDTLQRQVYEYEQLNSKLNQLNEEKTKYLIQATHQLKAPFAAIQSYTDIILEGYTGKITKRTGDIIQKIKRRCEMLTTSIQEMLELANLKSCVKDNLKMESVEIERILKDVMEQYRVIANQRGIRLSLEIPGERFRIRCNYEQVGVLFSNLVDNAIHYSRDGGEIRIALTKATNDKVDISVADQGIGIPEENLDRIWREYFRSNNAVAQHENGSGLGLSIVKAVSEIHGFSIAVKSILGQGTTFIVTAPLSQG